MKRSFWIGMFFLSGSLIIAGCGPGHEGGTLEIPENNPYELTPEQEEAQMKAKMNSATDLRDKMYAGSEAAADDAKKKKKKE